MPRYERKDAVADGLEIVRLWAFADEARCMLAISGDALELRLIEGARITKRAPYEGFSQARAAAREWRVEYEVAREARTGRPGAQCPECGEDAWTAATAAVGTPSLSCQSCGHAWTPAAGGGGSGRNGQRR